MRLLHLSKLSDLSGIVHDEDYNGGITWRRIENLLDEDKWQNYPLGKKTVMNVDGKEYVIEVYFLTNAN